MRASIQINAALCYIHCNALNKRYLNTCKQRISRPDSAALSRPEFMVLGGVRLTRKGGNVSVCACSTPRPPRALNKQKGGFYLKQEIEPMTANTTASRATTAPAQGTSDPTIQLHAQAHNSLAMACYYLRQPAPNALAARRQAVRALAALRNLSATLEG